MKSFIRKLINGDAQARHQLYEQYSGLVMGICRRYIKDSDLAQDAFQEVFIKIFSHVHQVDNEMTLAGWIRRLTINYALDCQKSVRYDVQKYGDGHELSDQFYSDLMDRLSVEAILRAIDKLPDGYRIILNMSIIDGYSHKEIADHLNISESTSRSQLTHAKRLLKRYLQELGITRYEQVV